MADVFISYSKQNRDIAEKLAEYLTTEGYVVWWDPSLVAGESYRAKIDQELNAARAIVVIWSPASVASEWVISEAEHGARQDNLITLRTADVDNALVPRPFNTRHMDLVTDFDSVRAALKRMAVEPLYKEDEHGLSPHDRYWAIIENSEHAEDFESYLQEFPDGAHAALARLTVARLKRRGPSETVKAAAVQKSSSGASGVGVGGMLAAALLGAVGAGAGSYAFWQLQYVPDRDAAQATLTSALDEVQTKQQAASDTLSASIDMVRRELTSAIQDMKAGQTAEAERSQILVKWAEEDKAWANATTSQLIEDWQAYLDQWPSGRYFADAKRAIELRRNGNFRIPNATWGGMARGGEIEAIAGKLKPTATITDLEGVIKLATNTITYQDNDKDAGWYRFAVYQIQAAGDKRKLLWEATNYVDKPEFRLFSPEGSQALIISGRESGTSAGSVVIIYSGSIAYETRVNGNRIVSAGLSEDRKLLVAKDSDNNAYAWDLTGLE